MVTRKTHVPRTRSRSKQAGTEWTTPPGHAVSVGAGVPNETPASPLIELRLVDELLSLMTLLEVAPGARAGPLEGWLEKSWPSMSNASPEKGLLPRWWVTG